MKFEKALEILQHSVGDVKLLNMDEKVFARGVISSINVSPDMYSDSMSCEFNIMANNFNFDIAGMNSQSPHGFVPLILDSNGEKIKVFMKSYNIEHNHNYMQSLGHDGRQSQHFPVATSSSVEISCCLSSRDCFERYEKQEQKIIEKKIENRWEILDL